MQDKKLCTICQKRKIKKNLSICSYCGSPDKITLYCAGCDNVQELNYTAITNLRKMWLKKMKRPLNIPANTKTGIVIKVTNCDKCSEPQETIIMIFGFDEDGGLKN